MARLLKFGLIGWLVLSLATLPLYWPYVRMIWVFVPNIQKPIYDTPASVTEARLQDIDYLSTLLRYDRAFSEEARETFLEKLDAIRQAAAEMNDAQFYLAIAEAVALGDNGHTNISYRPQYTEFKTIGARLYGFSDGVFILGAAPDKEDAIGRRVVAVEGTPIEELRSALGKYRGGNETWRTLYSALIIESPELLAASGNARSADAIELTLETLTGEQEDVQFAALSLDDPENAKGRSAWKTMLPDGGSPGFIDWPHVLHKEGAGTARFLTDTSTPMSYALEGNGLYIRALPGFTAGDQSIPKAYQEMLSDHPEGSLDYLVIDFRLHDGGDYTKSIKFAKDAPTRVKADGDIYIITGPNTFSAGIVTVAMLKYYAGTRGMIIGEQMGDREQFWAERGSSFRLPNSRYYINYATGYHDWEKGCKGEPFCFTMNEMHEAPAGSLAPTVSIPQDFESYRQGRDVVLEWIDQRH